MARGNSIPAVTEGNSILAMFLELGIARILISWLTLGMHMVEYHFAAE